MMSLHWRHLSSFSGQFVRNIKWARAAGVWDLLPTVWPRIWAYVFPQVCVILALTPGSCHLTGMTRSAWCVRRPSNRLQSGLADKKQDWNPFQWVIALKSATENEIKQFFIFAGVQQEQWKPGPWRPLWNSYFLLKRMLKREMSDTCWTKISCAQVWRVKSGGADLSFLWLYQLETTSAQILRCCFGKNMMCTNSMGTIM